MAKKIPIKKLNDSVTNYYPLGVAESVVTTHDIEVTGNIGAYKKGDIIPAVTTFDEIVGKLASGTGSEKVEIDNVSIITNNQGQLCVNSEKVDFLDKDQTITANKTFTSGIKFSESTIPEISRHVEDPDPDGSFEIPEGLPELSNTVISPDSGTYVISSSRNNGLIIKSGSTINLYIKENVEVVSQTDGIIIETGATLNLYNKGKIISDSDSYTSIYNEGTTKIKGGLYAVGKDNKAYYCILNHGPLLELWNASVTINSGNSSLLVTGYYYYNNGEGRGYIQEGKGSLTPKCIIHSGTYFNNSTTGTLKCDGGGTFIIYDGLFSGKGGQSLQNSGVRTEIHGGVWEKDSSSPTRLIYSGSDVDELDRGRNCELIITGGTFNCIGLYWLWLDFDIGHVVYPKISGAKFGTTTKYIVKDSESNDFLKLLDENCFFINKDSYINVYRLSDVNLNGIQFTNASIKNLNNDGIIITGVKDINDPSSAVSKAYVDSKETPIDNETIIKNSDGNIEVNENIIDKCMTSFEVIACSSDKTVHSILPNNKRYDRDAVYSPEGDVIIPSTREIKGNGMQHCFVLRVSLQDDEEESIANSDVIVDWGDGSKDRVVDIYNKWKNSADYSKWIDRQYNTGLLDTESEMNVQFYHDYSQEGVYIVKVVGKKFFGIRSFATLTGNTVAKGKSLLSRAYDDDLSIANNHVNHCSFCDTSPLLTEVYISTRIEFPGVHNQTTLFRNCTNLITAMGFRDKFRGVYSQSNVFSGCTSLILTDCKIKSVPGYNSAFASMYSGCSKLGVKFFNIKYGQHIDHEQILGRSTTDPKTKVTIDGVVITQFDEGDIVYYISGNKWDKRGLVYQYQTDKLVAVGNVCWNILEDLFPYNGLSVAQKLDVSTVFQNCSSLTANDYDYLSRMLWNNPITRFTSTANTFKNCSSLDLDKIPLSWGGTGTNVPTTMDISDDDGIKNAVKLLLIRNGFKENDIITHK